MEGAYYLATGNAKNFSEQQLLDCNAGRYNSPLGRRVVV